jgi:hypothetical protein
MAWVCAKKLFEINGIALHAPLARNLTIQIARKGNFNQFIAKIQESA